MTEGTELKLVTFDRTSGKEALGKLQREIIRAESAVEIDAVRDHVLNAFLTAWRVHEWIWDTIRERPDLRRAVLKYRGIAEDEVEDGKAFGAALAQRFVPLKICRLVANSSTFVRVVSPAEIEAQAALPMGGGVSGDLSGELEAMSALASMPTQFVPMILVMGKPMAATRILKEIESYWMTLIHECGIEQLP
jgi:hypothetical protein